MTFHKVLLVQRQSLILSMPIGADNMQEQTSGHKEIYAKTI